MTALADGIEELRDRVEADHEQAVRAALELDTQLRRPGLSAQEHARLEGELEFSFSRIDQLEQRKRALPDVKVTREADLYERGNREVDFFRDLVVATGVLPLGSPSGAQERLERHSKFELSRAAYENDAARRALGFYGIQARDARSGASERALSTDSGSAGAMVPPKWMTEQWASVSRAACPLKGLVTRVGLPDGTLELVIPRFDSYGGVVPMRSENTNPPDEYSETDDITATVATFTGDVVLSQQLYDRGPLASDEIALHDFAEAYGSALAFQLMNGTGSNGQMLGLLNVSTSAVNGVPGAILQTYTDASPTPTKIVQAVAQCAGQISDTRDRPPSVILMRGARWFYLSGSPDGSTNEPVQRPGTGIVPTDTDLGPYGPIASLPVFHDNTIPTDLGSGTDQDAITLVRAKDVILLEEPAGPRFTAYPSTNAAGQLTVVLQWHAYAAAFTDRYPSGIGSVQGTGLVVPTGF